MRPRDEVSRISSRRSDSCLALQRLFQHKQMFIFRTVTTEESTSLCSGFSGCGFIETSAKKNWNIDELFRQLFQLADLPPEMAPNSHRRLLPTQVY